MPKCLFLGPVPELARRAFAGATQPEGAAPEMESVSSAWRVCDIESKIFSVFQTLKSRVMFACCSVFSSGPGPSEWSIWTRIEVLGDNWFRGRKESDNSKLGTEHLQPMRKPCFAFCL